MKKHTNKFLVICPNCEELVAEVKEVEQKDRPGFFSNVSTPYEVPGRCETCDGFLARVPDYI